MTIVADSVMAPAQRRGRFHRLRVDAVEPVADDAVAVTLSVPAAVQDLFRFRAGQHLTLRFWKEGREERRSYSICVPESSPHLRIGVRRLPGGWVSSHIHDQLTPGDEVEVLEPAGGFTVDLAPGPERRFVALAAGSGITPVISLVATILGVELSSQVALLYGNRGVGTTMFLEELAALKDRHPSRLNLLHLFSRERQMVDSRNGRIDRDRLLWLGRHIVDPASVHAWLLCGPHAMVTTARATLAEMGVSPDRVRSELFFIEDVPPQRSAAEEEALSRPGEVTVSARLDGRESRFSMSRSEVLVDGLARIREDAPFSCKGGVCATCRARLVEGRVVMDHSYALDAADRAAGYILTCQSHPLTDHIVLDYDR